MNHVWVGLLRALGVVRRRAQPSHVPSHHVEAQALHVYLVEQVGVPAKPLFDAVFGRRLHYSPRIHSRSLKSAAITQADSTTAMEYPTTVPKTPGL